jgi:hypothetical protein
MFAGLFGIGIPEILSFVVIAVIAYAVYQVVRSSSKNRESRRPRDEE